MSIFNFRRGRPANAKASSKSSADAAPESVEVVRRRARHRLIGSAVLVLIGVVGFPLLFETQPRPVPVDIAIDIPSRASVKPALPVAPVVRSEQAAASSNAPAAPAAEASAPVSAQSSLHAQEEIVDAKPALAAKTEAKPKPETKPEAKPEAKVEARPEAKPAAKPDDGQRAKALLEGSPAVQTMAAEAEARLVVQVGAFSDAAKAREVRAKLEKAGLKTYTQVAETKDGKRIRVRVGPYATKAEADKAVTRIKSLDLPAAVLTL